MSELDEKLWAVISERGIEATGLTYSGALELRRELKAEKISGLGIVTSIAARRDAQQTTLRTQQRRKH